MGCIVFPTRINFRPCSWGGVGYRQLIRQTEWRCYVFVAVVVVVSLFFIAYAYVCDRAAVTGERTSGAWTAPSRRPYVG